MKNFGSVEFLTEFSKDHTNQIQRKVDPILANLIQAETKEMTQTMKSKTIHDHPFYEKSSEISLNTLT